MATSPGRATRLKAIDLFAAPQAIKVFRQLDGGLVALRTGYTPEEAFREIAEHSHKKLVLVEDARAAVLLECGLKQAGSHVLDNIFVQPSPGGVSQIYFDIGVYCRNPGSHLVVLDGDQLLLLAPANSLVPAPLA